MNRVIGLAMKYIIDFIKDNYGQEFLTEIRNSCDEDIREYFDTPIKVLDRYDYRFIAQVLEEFKRRKSHEEFVRLCQDSAMKQTRGFFGRLMQFAGYKFYCGKANFVWRRLFSEGSVTYIQVSENHAQNIIYDVALSKAHIEFIQYYQEYIMCMTTKKKCIVNYILEDEKRVRYNLIVKE